MKQNNVMLKIATMTYCQNISDVTGL